MKNKVFICPRCGSVDIKINADHLTSVIGVTPIDHKCRNCGFTSKVFPEIESKDIQSFREEIKKSKK